MQFRHTDANSTLKESSNIMENLIIIHKEMKVLCHKLDMGMFSVRSNWQAIDRSQYLHEAHSFLFHLKKMLFTYFLPTQNAEALLEYLISQFPFFPQTHYVKQP